MDESGKQPASEVDSDPAIVASPTTPIKKDKRGPEEVVETEVLGSKKQKIVNGDVEQAVERNNFQTETQENTKKEQTSSSRSEEEQNEENGKMIRQPNEVPSGAAKCGSIDKDEVEVPPAIKSATTSQDGKRDISFNESEEEEDEDEDDNSKKEAGQHLEIPNKCVEVPPTKKSAATEEKDGDDNSKEDEDQHLETPTESGTDVEMFDASSVKKTPQTPITSQATGSKTLLMSNLSFMIKKQDVINFFKNVGEIAQVHFVMKEDYFTGQAHVEFTTSEAAQEALRLNNELLLDNPVRLDLPRERGGHSATIPATGSKTVYLGNLSFSIEEDDVRDFFKDVGEIADIRFAIKDDKFLGYGHIDFTTAEAAQEALKLNKKVILDRRVKLDLARERGAYTPGCSIDKSNQKGGQAHGKTIFVRGFDSSDGFENIRSSLEKHFGKCGEISRMSIPKDYESGAPKGVAFIDFVDSNGFSRALELGGSEVGGSMLTVQEAKNQRGDSREGSGYGGRGWGGRSGSGGGWGGQTGSVGRWDGGNGSGGGQSGSGGRWGGGGQSGSGGRWGGGGENGSSGGRPIVSGSGGGGGWGRESGTGGHWASGRDRESGSGGGGRGREHGYGGGWGSGSGGARSSGSGYGGGRGSGSGYGGSGYDGGGRSSGSGYGGGGRSREGDSFRGGGWGGEIRGYSSSSSYGGSHGSNNNQGATTRP